MSLTRCQSMRVAPLAASLGLTAACMAPADAPRVNLPVVAAPLAGPITTDLGHTVTLASVRLAFKDLVFTTKGVQHAQLRRRAGAAQVLTRLASRALVPVAHAHPGHSQGGEVTGELPGHHVVTWAGPGASENPNGAPASLGTATLLAGTYTGADFTFDRAEPLGLDAEDPLRGHTAVLTGTQAAPGQAPVTFTVVLDAPVDRVLTGVPFDTTIDDGASENAGAHTLHLAFDVRAPSVAGDGATVFDGVDLTALDTNGDHVVALVPPGIALGEGSPDAQDPDAQDPDAEDPEGPSEAATRAYNTLRRAFLTHDHYHVAHTE